MIYSPVSRREISDALTHMRALHQKHKPLNARELLANERREAVIRDLLSNLPRTNEHPTLKTLSEIAEVCWLTVEGAHKLFGYNLGEVRGYDLRLNGGRTHIIESYPFERDQLIDFPLRLAPRERFDVSAMLRDLVLEWQTNIPIRSLDEIGWGQPGTFYVHVGTEDSLGSSIPPGATALVEPIDGDEVVRPNPRSIYLLQFGNGYRCSHCVVTRGKLRLFHTGKGYLGREEFIYPGDVRIAGRIRMFALGFPAPGYPSLHSLPECQTCADLILPWEHRSREKLFATKHKRFKRSKDEERFIRDILKADLNAKLSSRTERRYRSQTSSEPHVNALIHLTIMNFARYTDSLRTGGSWFSDKGRFSLELLLNASRLEDALILNRSSEPPTPTDVWNAHRREFTEWPRLLSMKFPRLQQWEDWVIRLGEDSAVAGLDPEIGPGSWMLLERIQKIPDTRDERRKTGWSRPLHVLRRGLQSFCGYLERDGDQYALLANNYGDSVKVTFGADELPSLNCVVGVAVPV